jgi:hypothetical protein
MIHARGLLNLSQTEAINTLVDWAEAGASLEGTKPRD